MFALCTPFIGYHNGLCWTFDRFDFDPFSETTVFTESVLGTRETPWPTITTAWNLIARIAVEPVVAQYIRDIDFTEDSCYAHSKPAEACPDVRRGGAMLRQLLPSALLEEIDVDWEEYYAGIAGDLHACRYSQRAAAFALALLPSVERVELKFEWQAIEATEQLVEAVVRRARQSPFSYSSRSGLAQTINFKVSSLARAPDPFLYMGWPMLLLTLPQMQYFMTTRFVAIDDGCGRIFSKPLYRDFGARLKVVNLEYCCIDEVAIADFLKHTPRLTTLYYSHSNRMLDGPRDWNLFEFVAAIEREVGTHLEKLSITIFELHGSILPGRASLLGCRRLWKLYLSLELALWDTAATAAANQKGSSVEGSPADEHGPDACSSSRPSIGDLIPATVSNLSIYCKGTDEHATALSALFRDFIATAAAAESTEGSELPLLKDFLLSRPGGASEAYKAQSEAYKAQSDVLCAAAEKTAVSFEFYDLAFRF